MRIERDDLQQQLEPYYFNSWIVDEVADFILALEPDYQQFVLGWVLSVAKTQPEIGYQFARKAGAALTTIDLEGCESWLQAALDVYFDKGLYPAVQMLKNPDQFIERQQQRSRGLELASVRAILQHFLHGLNGRHLGIDVSDELFTDSETLHLPEIIDHYAREEDNFACYRAIAVHQWAQCWYGTWRADAVDQIPRDEQQLALFHYLESLRLLANIERDYPGLARQIRALQQPTPAIWHVVETELSAATSSVFDSIRLSGEYLDRALPPPHIYQGKLDPEQVQMKLKVRLQQQKQQLRIALARMAEEHDRRQSDIESAAADKDTAEPKFELRTGQDGELEFELDGNPLPPDSEAESLTVSIMQDLGEMPPEYLEAAGSGEYRDSLAAQSREDDPNEVWKGTYHEKGAFLYDEWDCTRKAHRKRWCAVREKDVYPDYSSNFVDETLYKYRGHIKSLRRSFEALRDEYRILKKQPDGENLDIDALVEAISDVRSGMEMTSRIYRKAHRVERNIALVLMVDMSGSTKGWINIAQREALILLAEALQSLDDRYAIYGFSGNTRKRCEIYRIKTFEEAYDHEVRARIAGIEPQDYTRMGATIRHLTHLLDGINARTKLLITLSDGKPDDYDSYHGEYGIEDTRMALFEARQRGVHPFCITIDEQARDYLPHMYGDASYVFIDDIAKLPLRISEIYRSLTS